MSKEFAKGKKGPKGNNPMKTLKRMISYIFREFFTHYHQLLSLVIHKLLYI